MNKKTFMLGLVAISIIGTLAFAKVSEAQTIFSQFSFSKNEVLEGIAFDKATNETKQVVFLVKNYGNEKKIYLIIGDEIFKMEEIGNISKSENVKIFFYRSEDGNILTILIQKASHGISISADFKNYLISFNKTCCKWFNFTLSQNPGLGKIRKEVRNEVRTETRPIRGIWKII